MSNALDLDFSNRSQYRVSLDEQVADKIHPINLRLFNWRLLALVLIQRQRSEHRNVLLFSLVIVEPGHWLGSPKRKTKTKCY